MLSYVRGGGWLAPLLSLLLSPLPSSTVTAPGPAQSPPPNPIADSAVHEDGTGAAGRTKEAGVGIGPLDAITIQVRDWEAAVSW
jgi:hypothetical protein